MTRKMIFAVVFLLAAVGLAARAGGWFGGDDWASCILDKMPKAENDIAAALTAKACASEHPDFASTNRYNEKLKRYASADECFLSVGQSVGSRLGANMILGACRKAYGDPSFDPSTAVPAPAQQ
ncbi:hypothetical protein [Burkholderia cenocepacia]|uniref:hypothetical protein n=1 Tax=Burkholderia cenocepacia TaxID=95486 RepID=UPI002656A203|nr:hypothetical protein [Burkholderia cenocepacia]MDN7541951.1 hypothetical protein [Burkholderia cenocepacia]